MTIDEIQSLRQEYVGTLDHLIAEFTSEPGYDQAAVDAWTRERWRIAGSSERPSCLVAVGK